jgi:hypothetical protein
VKDELNQGSVSFDDRRVLLEVELEPVTQGTSVADDCVLDFFYQTVKRTMLCEWPKAKSAVAIHDLHLE